MSVGFNTWGFPNSTVFIVKNIGRQRRTIKIFNAPIEYGQELDLLRLNYVSEADIRNSLLKGDLNSRVRKGQITVVETNIDLTQYDEEQKEFLKSAGIEVGSSTPQPYSVTFSKRNTFNQNTWLRVGNNSMSNARGWPSPINGTINSFYFTSDAPTSGPFMGIRIIHKRAGDTIYDETVDVEAGNNAVKVIIPTISIEEGDTLHVRGAVGSSGNNQARNPILVMAIS